ncbi:MAG: 50S ribosomal protein L29 [Thermofilum sp. ex4484_79]|nr:MAG: 50S ribosomal protein L29 [Thermofilum sp. ex4484_79]
MVILRMNEIRSMSQEERMKRLTELRTELIRLRVMAERGILDDPGRLRETRKTIARILTVMREEELKKK